MVDAYKSRFTGYEVDTAVEIALTLDTKLVNYINKQEIGVSVPSLVGNKVPLNNLPVATTITAGMVYPGDGLTITADGSLSVDSNQYYNKQLIDTYLSRKADISELEELTSKFNNFNDYSITINKTGATTDSVYHRLTVVNIK